MRAIVDSKITIEQIADHIRASRCFNHPIFRHWASVKPGPRAIGALFHQIRSFCDSTRPGGAMPTALAAHGLAKESHLLQEIVDSEENHGPELATMAGHILNRAASKIVCPDLWNQAGVEAELKRCSDELLATLPGYDRHTGLTIQCRAARAVFERRHQVDRETTLKNLGTALALEVISNRQLIPGEKLCLVDSELYDATLNEPEMHYLKEHWGEVGAEAQHEKNAFTAVQSILNEKTAQLVMTGVNDFLESLAALWDVLDASLLHSGIVETSVQRSAVSCAG